MDKPKRDVADHALHALLIRKGSFPKGERPEPYQEYYSDHAWRPGQREVTNRAKLMGFCPKIGDSVLELGSQMGGFLQLAMLEGATWVEGIELDEDHCAVSTMLIDGLKDALQAHHVHSAISMGDITENSVLAAAKSRLPSKGLDHLLILSMGKHIGGPEVVEKLVKHFGARHTYIETNAVVPGRRCPYGDVILKLGGTRVGETTDRNNRMLYRVDR